MKVLTKALLALAMPFCIQSDSQAQNWKPMTISIPTRWTKQVNAESPLPEYPRPQLVRKRWQNLNGIWEYAITAKNAEKPMKYVNKILVPYPIESSLSGVQRFLKPDEALWYKRNISKPKLKPKERVMLNFGAVDFEATIYLNGKEIGKHVGGYQSFSFDVTSALTSDDNELVIKVWDPSDQGPSNPHGKQALKPQGIMYTSSSGIWQTVWLETVPDKYVESLKITPDVERGVLNIVVNSNSSENVSIRVFDTTKEVALMPRNDANKMIEIPIKNAKLWSPDDPFLYELEITLGEDKVKSYFGMRKVEIKKDPKGIDRIYLNGKYTYNLGTLDQGFWPDGLYTAPTDEALAFDIMANKAMGFNTIRKHIKVEPARWYYHADKLGMLVWQDMVNPGFITAGQKAQFEKEVRKNVAQLYNHPSIITWVLFNEKWGQYDQERLTKELKILDPTRLVNGHSGEMLYVNDKLKSPSPNAWVGADMTDVHAYPNPGHIKFEKGKAAVLGEFGGIGVPIEGHLWDDLKAGWGYDGVVTPAILQKQYANMVDSLRKFEAQGLTASIYTQPFDVETEQNGLITYDREVIKLPIDKIREIHSTLWPITKNFKGATKGFSAIVAIPTNTDYNVRLDEYNKGKRDMSFLRNLCLMAKSQKDTVNARNIANHYINSLDSSEYESKINFIEQFTNSISDPGFLIIRKWLSKNLGSTQFAAISHKFQNILFKDLIITYLGDSPNWEEIEKLITSSKPLDCEVIRSMCVDYYLRRLAPGQLIVLRNLIDAATMYDEAYNKGRYNAWAWEIFNSAKEKYALEKALIWAKKGIDTEHDPIDKAAATDTFANLLYKLGRTSEALLWQEKAVAGNPDAEDIKMNYERMKAGAKTWPEVE
ncbi:sugar-binding domain-containing protein [Pedobacter faecalis]|uniref:sugar-binding domain-containing protein n=1 Tax=Pedobacter faecalis TaxID=3041495 RepID=UPI00254DFF94|nr:sugar-binding domain-containing protein [Pedobacter sp. ELA7]